MKVNTHSPLSRSIYLKAHLYSNAKTPDLWNGISEASGEDVASFMANWTQKVRKQDVELIRRSL